MSKFEKILSGAVLAGFLGSFVIAAKTGLPEGEIVKRNSFPPTVLIDTNNDGECDRVKVYIPVNRQMKLIYYNPTEEEKRIYIGN